MNKSGKVSGILTVGVIVGLVILSVIAYSLYSVANKPIQITTGTSGLSGSGCAINPSIVYALSDTLSPGTATTATAVYRLNGAYTTTAPTTKGNVEILLTNTSYVGKIVPSRALDCGTNLVTENLYLVANATETFYSDNGLLALSSLATGSPNETNKGNGASYNWKMHLQGTDKKSTGKQMFIIELSTPGNVSSVSVSGAEPTTVPNGYTRQGTNSYVAAFLLPAITGNVAQDFNIAISAASSKQITGTVYTALLGLQPFVETDGTFSDSGKAYDSVNTAKYTTTTVKNLLIV